MKAIMWMACWMVAMALGLSSCIVIARSCAGMIAASAALIALVASATAMVWLIKFTQATFGGRTEVDASGAIACAGAGLALTAGAHLARIALQRRRHSKEDSRMTSSFPAA